MKIIQSFWTKNISQEILEKNVVYYSLSAKLLKASGLSVELYTDSKGKEAISKYNYYDQIHNHLDAIKDFPSELWSVAKVLSLIAAKEPAMHIDGDVFFRNPIFLKNILDQKWDILVQSQEVNEHYYYQYDKSIDIFNSICKFEDPWTPIYLKYYNYTYNCGVLGFREYSHLLIYAKKYFELFDVLKKSPDLIYKYNSLRDERCWIRGAKVNINCILEQIQLTFFSNFYNLKVKELIPIYQWDDPKWQYHQNFKEDIGYEHLAGQEKFTDDSLFNKYKLELEEDLKKTDFDNKISKWKNY